MPNKRINQFISELSLPKKILGLGVVLMAFSLFFPWYQDKDTFGTGVEFSGITGPLFLMGLSVLALSGLCVAAIILSAKGKKIPFLPFKTSVLYLFTGLFSFYVLIVANSIYFHPYFGLNITFKQSRFGMFIAFIAASLITIGGYLDSRDRSSVLKEFHDEIGEPVIKVPEQEKPKANIRKEIPAYESQSRPVQQTIEQAKIQNPNRETQYVQHSQPQRDEQISSPQPFRTDL